MVILNQIIQKDLEKSNSNMKKCCKINNNEVFRNKQNIHYIKIISKQRKECENVIVISLVPINWKVFRKVIYVQNDGLETVYF